MHSFITPLELAASKQAREVRIFKEKGNGSIASGNEDSGSSDAGFSGLSQAPKRGIGVQRVV